MESIDLFLDRPVALLAVLIIGALIGAGVERMVEQGERARRKALWRVRDARRKGNGKVAPLRPRAKRAVDPADFAADQLKVVCRADFAARPLLNRAEAKVFDALDKAVMARNPDWQVMAQVSLGEFLQSPDDAAFRAVNSKRVDFALMDGRARVVHALEYQGSGHHAGTSAAARDAVKKEALRKAGIGYHEVVAGHTTPGDLRALVERLVTAG